MGTVSRPVAVFAVGVSLASGAMAGLPSGRWEGSYRCHGADNPMTVTITPDSANAGRAVMEFNANGVRGSYGLTAHMREDSLLLRLTPSQWIRQPDPRYMMIGFEGRVEGGRITGKSFGIAECTDFTLSQGAAPPQTTSQQPPSPPRPVPAPSIPAVVTPAPAAAPAQVPAARPAGEIGQGTLFGQWALNLPGGGMWTSSFEDDFARMIRTTTHSMTISRWLSNAGALEIKPDGTYRINWNGVRWNGRWTGDGEYGGLRLLHPSDSRKDWVVFLRDGKPRGAQASTISGFTLTEMVRIGDASVAEYLLTPTSTGDLLGRWTLSDSGVGMGVIEISADGTYRHSGGPDGELAGRWVRGRDDIILQNYGRAGSVSLHADATVPGRVVISGGAVQMVGVR